MDASTAENGIVHHQCVLKTTHYCLICSALSSEYSRDSEGVIHDRPSMWA
jgi:hypothetical protein